MARDPQTIDQVTATWDAARQALVGQVQPQGYDRKVVLMALDGPRGSTLQIYRGYIPTLSGLMVSITPAAARTYDAAGKPPIVFHGGEAATFIWSGGKTSALVTASANVISDVS